MTKTAWWLAAVAIAAAAPRARAQVGDSYKVQAPELSPPGRGSLAGSFSQTAFGPGDVERGSFVLPSPYSAPEERGPLLADIFPSYSAEAGISEWGMGWASALALTRWRDSGSLDYATDDLTGPFGRCQKGADGNWYPVGLAKLVRIESVGAGFVAYTSDGARWTFGQVARVVTPTGTAPSGTYAWYLDQIETSTGRKASLTYAANPSGRLFLTEVDYGGTGTSFQHRVTIDYTSLAKTFTDYRAGFPLTLDRRVSGVTAWSKHATTGAWQARRTFTPTYRFDVAGPAFYLAQVDQTYPSGDTAPPVRYGYELSPDTLASASLTRSAKFDAVVAAYGAAVVLPSSSTVLDAGADGLADLEVASDNTLIRQGSTGYSFEALPPATATASKNCRASASASNLPRTLATMRASPDDVQVVSLTSNGVSTSVLICDRAGEPLFGTTLSNNWTLGPKTRLVDLDRDHQPDLIQVFTNGYQVIPNTSTAAGFSFGAPIGGTLNLAFPFSGVWIQDFNGDGLPDIITRTSSLVVVYFNKGRFKFDPTPHTYQVRDAAGHPLDPSPYKFTWVDADGDGMIDLLLSTSSAAFLFRNAGDAFVPVNVGGNTSVSASATLPLFVDLNGSGNAEVFFIIGGAGYAVALNGPGTGLLRTADDGKGTRLTFGWDRAAAAAGLRSRHPVIASVISDSLGRGALTTSYAYASPTVHSRGKFLVGYGQVTASTSVGTHSVTFLNSDFFAGLASSSRRHDVNAPQVDAIEQRTYEDATYQGLPWKRLKVLMQGWQGATGVPVTERIDYDTFEAEVCPSRTTKTTASGTLVTVSTRALIPGFGNALHCLPARVDMSGTHADPALYFSHSVLLSRNDAGLVTQVQSQTAGDTSTVQTIAYNPDYTVASISSPGRGTALFGYAATTGLLASTTRPDGTLTEAISRDPVTDGILQLRVTRGTLAYNQFFRFDNQERLQKQWDDLGVLDAASELSPTVRYSYQFATATTPAAIASTQLVDAAGASIRDSIDLLTAAGEGLATASRIPEGWSLGRIVARDRATASTRHLLRPTLAVGVDPRSLDYGALLAGASEVGSEIASSFGHASDARTTFHATVEQHVAKGLAISGDLLALTSTENGLYQITSWLDGGKRLVADDDEAGVRHAYTYDALGRLRRVSLPDGTAHVVSYDGHGRVSRIERGGVATVETSFDAVSGLVAAKRFLSPAGALLRSVSYVHDDLGRVTAEIHTDAAGVAKTFRHFYDGATPAAPAARTTLGLLTATTGDGYTKLFAYRADGVLQRRTVILAGWRTVETTFAYLEGGVAASRTTTIRDAGGAILGASTRAFTYDASGRLAAETLDGADFVTYRYGANGELTTATFANGDVVTMAYDDLTRRWVGSSQTTGTFAATTSQRMGPRGLVETEGFASGGTSLTRTYDYSAQRFLLSSRDGSNSYGYGFDASGLSTSVAKNGQTTLITRSGATLTAGVTYVFDELGRTIRRGGLSLAYGPDGQIATATQGASAWSFLHDEAGQRLVKLSGGVPVAAYLAEGYLDAGGLTELVALAGRTVGTLENGVFTTVPTDARGSVVADASGTSMLPSPFGQRTWHPSTAPALDYVEKGYDADLGLVRIGVRDYDPEINRFTTPDPLVLESPKECLEDPADCNLYGYARNSPATLVDRDGQAPTVIGHVYVVEGTLRGESLVYTGSTSQGLPARFSTHEWKELIRAPGTKVTIYEATGTLNVAASGRGTTRSATNEALRSVEQPVKDRMSAKGARVLNKMEAAAEGNAELWEARHSVKLGPGKTWTPVFAAFALLDIVNAYRDEKMSRYVMAPYMFQDDGGSFNLYEERTFIFYEYQKVYLEGPLAGKSVTINRSEFTAWKNEGELLWGHLDFWNNFVPGLLRPELPEIPERPEIY